MSCCKGQPSWGVGDSGDLIRFIVVDRDENQPVCCDQTVSDISTGTTLRMVFTKPDGTEVTKEGPNVVFQTDGTDGAIQYVIESGLLDTKGFWKVRAVVIATAFTVTTPNRCFTVH